MLLMPSQSPSGPRSPVLETSCRYSHLQVFFCLANDDNGKAFSQNTENADDYVSPPSSSPGAVDSKTHICGPPSTLLP